LVIGSQVLDPSDRSLMVTYTYCFVALYDMCRRRRETREFPDRQGANVAAAAMITRESAKKLLTGTAALAKEIANQQTVRASVRGTEVVEHAFARARRCARKDQSVTGITHALIEVIHHNTLRCDLGIEANVDATTHRDNHADVHFPPVGDAALPALGTVLRMVMHGLTRTGVDIPLRVVRQLDRRFGTHFKNELAEVARRRDEGSEEPWEEPLLDERFNLELLTRLRGSSTAQCHILSTYGMSKARFQASVQLAKRGGCAPDC
jgi:hypothetical protein